MLSYANEIRSGIDAVASLGDGSSINIKWFQAYTNIASYQVAYHIYYSTIKENVYSEGVKLVSIDGSIAANIIGLTPGQRYFISVRPVEYDPNLFNLLNLPIAHDNLRFYPSNMLRQDISATDTVIPIFDITGFPNTGVIKIGIELIQYISVDVMNKSLIVAGNTAGVSATFILQSNGQYYLPASTNVGKGAVANLTFTGGKTPLTEIWAIKCISDGYSIDGYSAAKFEAIGSISGQQLDGYGNTIIWTANGGVKFGNILSFSIVETAPHFKTGDSFTIKVLGIQQGVQGGRGYNSTPATLHTISGFDGYDIWSPILTLFTLTESYLWDRIYLCQSRFEYPNFPFTTLDGYHQVQADFLSTDLSAADAANISFPMYDYAGYHRTDPVQLLNGTCVGSYIGGEMGCIDSYGNYNILRGMSLQDQNTQRQEIELSITGKPAVLIRKVQTGVTCSCYLASSENPDDRCPFCFVPGTLINTQNGFMPIENIKIGDMVLGFDGEFHKVLNTHKNNYIGKLKSITATTTVSPILCTPDHPFLSLGGAHHLHNKCGPNSNCKSFISRGDGKRNRNDIKQLPSGRWHARVQANGHKRITLGTFDTKEQAQNNIDLYLLEHNIPGHQMEWKNAKELKNNSWVKNSWYRHIKDISTIEIPLEFIKNTKLGSLRNGVNIFNIDLEFLWIIGLYLAEGSSGKRSINFALHKNEIEYADKIKKYFSKYGYTVSSHYTSKNGQCVYVYSTTLAQWFPSFLGKLCNNKKIPNEFMYLPDDKSEALIQGIFDGDAGKRDLNLVQTSQILALQVTEILHRLGHQPLVKKIVNNILTPKGNKRKIAYEVNKELLTFNRINRKGRWQFNENLLTKIRKIEDVEYNGPVYNLEVDGDHTYVVQNIVVHNCYGTKFVFGYEQYFNPRSSDGRIKVRPGPTVENLKIYEAGLESEFPLDLWSLTVPTIKTRDIIVLFDQNDNESFRYEVAGVTRNDTILGLDGGQKLSTFRIRKTDPAYQIRIFRDTASFPSKLNTSLGFALGLPPHSHQIVINEKILAVNQINQTTAVSQGHNHPIIAGIVQAVLGHTHTIILP